MSTQTTQIADPKKVASWKSVLGYVPKGPIDLAVPFIELVQNNEYYQLTSNIPVIIVPRETLNEGYESILKIIETAEGHFAAQFSSGKSIKVDKKYITHYTKNGHNTHVFSCYMPFQVDGNGKSTVFMACPGYDAIKKSMFLFTSPEPVPNEYRANDFEIWMTTDTLVPYTEVRGNSQYMKRATGGSMLSKMALTLLGRKKIVDEIEGGKGPTPEPVHSSENDGNELFTEAKPPIEVTDKVKKQKVNHIEFTEAMTMPKHKGNIISAVVMSSPFIEKVATPMSFAGTMEMLAKKGTQAKPIPKV